MIRALSSTLRVSASHLTQRSPTIACQYGRQVRCFSSVLELNDTFVRRHIGPSDDERDYMLNQINMPSMEELVKQTVPANILSSEPLALEAARTETEALKHLHQMISANELKKSFIGMGYYDTVVPSVVLRNMLE